MESNASKISLFRAKENGEEDAKSYADRDAEMVKANCTSLESSRTYR